MNEATYKTAQGEERRRRNMFYAPKDGEAAAKIGASYTLPSGASYGRTKTGSLVRLNPPQNKHERRDA